MTKTLVESLHFRSPLVGCQFCQNRGELTGWGVRQPRRFQFFFIHNKLPHMRLLCGRNLHTMKFIVIIVYYYSSMKFVPGTCKFTFKPWRWTQDCHCKRWTHRPISWIPSELQVAFELIRYAVSSWKVWTDRRPIDLRVKLCKIWGILGDGVSADKALQFCVFY